MPRRSVLLCAGLLTLIGCSTAPGPSGPSGSPSSPPASPAANACDPGSTTLTSYPGWPGASAETPTTTELVPLLVSSELAVGPNRFLFSLIDGQNRLVAAPAVEVDVSFFDLAADPEVPVAELTAAYLQADEERGLYRAAVEFSCSGSWGAELTARIPGREQRRARVIFSVRPESGTPGIGSPVPATDTPTAESPEGIKRISTDADPDRDFYRLSVAEALEQGRPFALIFATPAFCQTQACGPTLDIVRDAAADFKDEMAFIHVEPYVLEMTEAGLQPVLNEAGRFQVVPSATDWGLPSEPFIFVVDGEGLLAAKFEGVAGADELREAFAQVAAE